MPFAGRAGLEDICFVRKTAVGGRFHRTHCSIIVRALIMKQRLESRQIFHGLTVGLVRCPVFLCSTSAHSIPLRDQFILHYKSHWFDAHVALIKANKDVILSQIRSLVNDALSRHRDFEEKICLFDAASAMASCTSIG